MPDVHRLGDVRRTKINNHGRRPRNLFKKELFVFQCVPQSPRDGRLFEAEIQKTGASDFNRIAPFADVQLCYDVRSYLTRIELARFRERHDRGSLIVSKPRLWTW